jgi:hypothetical protein
MQLAARAVLALGLCAMAPVARADGNVKMPKFEKQLTPGEFIVAIDVEVHCLGVSELRGIPDWWNASLKQDRETYFLRLEPWNLERWLSHRDEASLRRSNRALQDFSFRYTGRGQYSDCSGLRMTVHTKTAEGTFASTYSNRILPSGWDFGGRKPE